MTAGALPDSSSVAPLYHNINKGKLLICRIDMGATGPWQEILILQIFSNFLWFLHRISQFYDKIVFVLSGSLIFILSSLVLPI